MDRSFQFSSERIMYSAIHSEILSLENDNAYRVRGSKMITYGHPGEENPSVLSCQRQSVMGFEIRRQLLWRLVPMLGTNDVARPVIT